MKIVTKKEVSDEHWAHLTQWRERVFPEEGIGKEWTSTSWHALAYADDNHPAGHIGFDGFTVRVDSAKHLMIGIGGVVVRPEYQGRGIPALLFDEVHHQGKKEFNSEVFALFCPSRLVSYYQRHGYRAHTGSVHILQRGIKTPSSFAFMVRGNIAPDSAIELESAPW